MRYWLTGHKELLEGTDTSFHILVLIQKSLVPLLKVVDVFGGFA